MDFNKGDCTEVVSSLRTQYGYYGELHLIGNKVVMDTSNGEYGPVVFSLQLLLDAINRHGDKAQFNSALEDSECLYDDDDEWR